MQLTTAKEDPNPVFRGPPSPWGVGEGGDIHGLGGATKIFQFLHKSTVGS